MRYGTIPKGLKETLASFLGVVPYPMLDVLIAPLQARALIAAERTGVFKALGSGRETTSSLASKLSLDASCLDLVLRLVASMGYLSGGRGMWSLSKLGQKHFGPRAPNPFHDFVAFGAPQWEWVSQLEDVLRTGKGVEIHRTLTAAEWPIYQRAMAEGARDFASFIAKELPVAPGATVCLDVAGSHGLVGAALCRAHPGMRSIVLERAEALAEAQRLATDAGVTDVVTFRECDLLREEFGQEADAVVFANILHHFSPDANQDILRRAKRALKKGGSVGIFDIEAPRPEAPPEAAGDGAALFFRITSNSACFNGDDYAGWLSACGFSDVRIVRSLLLPSRLLATARVR